MTSHGPGSRYCRAARNQSRKRGLAVIVGSCAMSVLSVAKALFHWLMAAVFELAALCALAYRAI